MLVKVISKNMSVGGFGGSLTGFIYGVANAVADCW